LPARISDGASLVKEPRPVAGAYRILHAASESADLAPCLPKLEDLVANDERVHDEFLNVGIDVGVVVPHLVPKVPEDRPIGLAQLDAQCLASIVEAYRL